jgi:hypothetical protein
MVIIALFLFIFDSTSLLASEIYAEVDRYLNGAYSLALFIADRTGMLVA